MIIRTLSVLAVALVSILSLESHARTVRSARAAQAVSAPAGGLPMMGFPTGGFPKQSGGALPNVGSFDPAALTDELRACTAKLIPSAEQIKQIQAACMSVDPSSLTQDQLNDLIDRCTVAPAVDPAAFDQGLQSCFENIFKKFGI